MRWLSWRPVVFTAQHQLHISHILLPVLEQLPSPGTGAAGCLDADLPWGDRFTLLVPPWQPAGACRGGTHECPDPDRLHGKLHQHNIVSRPAGRLDVPPPAACPCCLFHSDPVHHPGHHTSGDYDWKMYMNSPEVYENILSSVLSHRSSSRLSVWWSFQRNLHPTWRYYVVLAVVWWSWHVAEYKPACVGGSSRRVRPCPATFITFMCISWQVSCVVQWSLCWVQA